MELKMKRLMSSEDETLGVLQCGDHMFATLEDEFRKIKVPGETRIPAGTYDIKLRSASPMAQRYEDKFGPSHAGIPWLQDVPGFEWVYLHIGNDDDDTAGCILVANAVNFAEGTLLYSTPAYNHIQSEIQHALNKGESVTITIED